MQLSAYQYVGSRHTCLSDMPSDAIPHQVSGCADWNLAFDNKAAIMITFALLASETLLCSRTHPPNPPHQTYNLSNTKKKEMSQSCVGENRNNNNSFNSNSFNSFNSPISFNNVCNVTNFGGLDEGAEVLAWLSPLEHRIRHHDIRARRVADVGDWLLRTDEYQNWFGGIGGGEPDGSVLFCHGDPGVGKTYIRYETVFSMSRRYR